MNDQPLTRRDVVALFAYVFLSVNALSILLLCLSEFVLPRIPLFASLFFARGQPVILLAGCALQLLLLPLVPLVASGAVGRKGNDRVSARDVRSLLLPCIGITLLTLSLSRFISYACYYFASTPPRTGTALIYTRISAPSVYLTLMAGQLIQVSLGFALAFFPAIFDTLRHRMRGEHNENAA
jgi:hypothetical protein